MDLRSLAATAGLLGGLCWVARWVADLASGEPAWGPAAYVAGLVLLGLALAGVGAGLVSSSATWLRVIVAIALPALVWSVYSVVRGESGSLALDGVLGVVAVVLCAAEMVLARRRTRAARPRRAGSHSR
jgi:hypothetical protein